MKTSAGWHGKIANTAGASRRIGPAKALGKDPEPRVPASGALTQIGELDVAGAVVFLASEAAPSITGKAIVINGDQQLGDARLNRYGAMSHV